MWISRRPVARASKSAVPQFQHGWQVYDGCEVCAGIGMLSKVAGLHGYTFPAMDIVYWEKYANYRPCCNNPLDMLGDAGFGHLATQLEHIASVEA